MEIIAAEKTVVCKNPPDQRTKSGLSLAEDKKPELGLVVAIGKGDMPVEMKAGDTIVFRRYSDNRIYIEGIEYNFIRFEDVVGVLCLKTE